MNSAFWARLAPRKVGSRATTYQKLWSLGNVPFLPPPALWLGKAAREEGARTLQVDPALLFSQTLRLLHEPSESRWNRGCGPTLPK